MTGDELYLELPRLTAFAKIVFLDRAVAHAAIKKWLTAAVSGSSPQWLGRVDAYRGVVMFPLHSQSAQHAGQDRLPGSWLRELSARERAWWLLTGPLGFSDDVAEDIVKHMPLRAEIAAPGARPVQETDLNLGPWPDLRILRLAG